MIKDIPEADDFREAGLELFDFAWDIAAVLWTNLGEAINYGVDVDESSEQQYWAAAKRRLTTALAMTQQGVEFFIKAQIAEISPYLLLIESPSKWPSPYTNFDLSFTQFKTVDAQDLVKLHDTVCNVKLTKDFVNTFNVMQSEAESYCSFYKQEFANSYL